MPAAAHHRRCARGAQPARPQAWPLAGTSALRSRCQGTTRNTMAGDGPRILLLHGLAATGAVWTPLLGCLPGAAQVWAPDLPGHGSAPRCERYELAALAAAVSRYQADVV